MSCFDTPAPNFGNICTNYPLLPYPESTSEVPHFCGLFLDCNKLSNAEEWFPTAIRGQSCNSIGNNTLVPHGCPFNNRGFIQLCHRIAYTGETLPCCMKDYDFSQNLPDCFSDPTNPVTQTGNNTCPPDSRNISNLICKNAVPAHCINDPNWKDFYDPSCSDFANPQNPKCDCIRAIYRNIYGQNFRTGKITDISGVIWAENLITQAFNKFIAEGFNIGVTPLQPGYHPFQESLKSICFNNPELCRTPLKTICSKYTTTDIINSPALLPFCGCYLPDKEYEKYVNQFKVSPECTPTCARQGVIPLATENGLSVKTCDRNICIIDNTNIKLTNSYVQNGVSINQVCGSCAGTTVGSGTVKTQSCICIIADNNISVTNSEIKGGIQIEQLCNNNNSTCYRQSPTTGNQVQVPCDTPQVFNPDVVQPTQNTTNITIILFVVGGLMLFVFLVMIFTPS